MTSEDPAGALQRLNARDRVLFEAWITPVVTERTETRSRTSDTQASPLLAAAACWSKSLSYTSRNVAGLRLYAHGQSTEVCVTSGRVSSVKVFGAWRSTYFPGWDYIGGYTETRNVRWEGRGLMQSHFRYEIAKLPVLNVRPCVQLRLNANRVSALGNYSCNIA